MGEAFAILGVTLGVPTILAWIFRTYLNHKRFMKILQLKADLNAKLLDRLGTDPQAIEFFRSDIQKDLLEIRTPEQLPSAYGRMLTSVQAAAVLTTAGIALLWVRQYMYGDDQEAMLFMGALAVALGIGAALSAAAAYLVSRMWENSRDGKLGAGV